MFGNNHKRFFSGLFVLCISALLLCISYAQVLVSYERLPSGRYYYGQVVYPLDFLETLAVVENGRLGRWSGYLSFKEFPRNPSDPLIRFPDIIRYEYLIIGHIARVLNISSLTAIYFSKFILTFGVFVTTWWFTGLFLRNRYRIFAYVLTLYAVPITIPSLPWQTWPTELIGDAVQIFHRYTFVSNHYLIGYVCSLLSVGLLFGWLFENKRSQSVPALVSGLIVSYVNVPPLILIDGALLITVMIMIWKKKLFQELRTTRIRTLMITSVYIAVTLLPAIAIRPNLTRYFWDLQAVTYTNINVNSYMLSIGILGICSIIGACTLIQRKCQYAYIFLICLVMLHPFITLVIEPLQLFSAKRMFQTPYLVFYAILGIYGIQKVADYLSKKHIHLKHAIELVILIILFVTGFHTYIRAFRPEAFIFTLPMDLGYPKKEQMDGVFWIRDHSDPDDMILTSYYSGTFVASFTGRYVPSTWWTRIVDPNNPLTISILDFYREWLSDENARNLLTRLKARYILYGEDERANNPNRHLTLSYPFLKEIYRSGSTIVYEWK